MSFASRASVLVIGCILLWAAIDKALHWEAFIRTLGMISLLSFSVVGAFGAVVIVVEVLVAASLFLPPVRRDALLMAAFLFLGFAAWVGSLAVFKPGSSCGCSFTFGPARATVHHLVLNLLLVLLSVFQWRTVPLPEPPVGEANGCTGGSPDSLSPLSRRCV